MDPFSARLSQLWRRLPLPAHATLVAVGLYGLGHAALLLRPPGTSVALWWPAAGLAVVAILQARPHERTVMTAVVLTASLVANLLGGRPPAVAALYAVANTVEAVVVVRLLSRGGPDPRSLATPWTVVRLLVATVAGTASAGVIAGTTAWLLLDASWVQASWGVLASHTAAVLIAVPLVGRTATGVADARWPEIGAQLIAVSAVTVVVFAPGQRLGLTFLLFVPILWAALRSTLGTVALQVLLVGGLASVLTARGGGPFALVDGNVVSSIAQTVALVQVLVVSLVLVALGLVAVVDQRRAALREISRREELFRRGFASALLGSILVEQDDGHARIVEINGVAARMLQASPVVLIGSDVSAWMTPPDAARFGTAIDELDRGVRTGWGGEVVFERQDEQRWLELSVARLDESTASRQVFHVQMVDVTLRRAAEERLATLALRDELTGLANRLLLDDRLDHALAEARRAGTLVGVLFVDLDRFKPINDTFGHTVGDRVLQLMAVRLLAAVRDLDTVARFGGDEFVVVCPGLTDVGELDDVRERLAAALAAPVDVAETTLCIGASIGAVAGRGSDDARALLAAADAAMYRRKAVSPREEPAFGVAQGN